MRKFLCLMTSMFLVTLLVCSCSADNHDSDSGTIQKKNLSALIIGDDGLVPIDNLTWHMPEDEFLSGVYGSEAFDQESKSYEPHRVGKMQNGWTSYNPLLEVTLKDYKVSAKPTCVFDEDDGLIAVTYTIMIPDDSADQYKDILNHVCTEADSIHTLQPSIGDFQAFTTEDVLTTRPILQWVDDISGCYFEVNSLDFSNTLTMTLRVSAVDLRGDDTF